MGKILDKIGIQDKTWASIFVEIRVTNSFEIGQMDQVIPHHLLYIIFAVFHHYISNGITIKNKTSLRYPNLPSAVRPLSNSYTSEVTTSQPGGTHILFLNVPNR